MKYQSYKILFKLLCLALLTIIPFVNSKVCFAQTKTDTFNLKASYPFDQKFILKHPIKKHDSIVYANLFEMRKGCIVNSLSKRCKKNILDTLLKDIEKQLLIKGAKDTLIKDSSRNLQQIMFELEIHEDTIYTPYKINLLRRKIDSLVSEVKTFDKNILMGLVNQLYDTLRIVQFKLYEQELDSSGIQNAMVLVFEIASVLSRSNNIILRERYSNAFLQLQSLFNPDSYFEKRKSPKLTQFIDSLNSHRQDSNKNNFTRQDSVNVIMDIVEQKEDFVKLLYNSMASNKLEIKGHDSENVFIDMKRLEPNKNYFLILLGKTKIEKMDEILTALYDGDYNLSKKLYDEATILNSKMLITDIDNYCLGCSSPLSFSFQKFEDFYKYYNVSIKQVYSEMFKKKNKLLEKKLNLSECGNISLSTDEINSLIKMSKECLKCKDTLWQYEWLKKTEKNLTLSFLNLSRLNDTVVSYGYAELDYLGPILASEINFDNRIKNLKTSIETIHLLKKLIIFYNSEIVLLGGTKLDVDLSEELTILENNYTALFIYKKEVEEIKSNIKKIKESIDKVVDGFNGFLMPSAAMVTNTYTWGFDARTGFAVKPDFGFMGYGDFWNDSEIFGVSPYIGFHLNFRPLNTDVPWNDIVGWKKYFSFTAGTLIASLKEEGKREGLIGNTSIFTGLGLAFGHGVRLNTGSVWYKRFNNNPLITSKRVSATPYIGLSIDFRIKDIYNSFIKLYN